MIADFNVSLNNLAYSFIFKAAFRLKDNRAFAPFYEAFIHFCWAGSVGGGSGFIQSAWVNTVPVLYPSDTRLLRQKTWNTSLLWCVSGLSSESVQWLSREPFHHARPLHCYFPRRGSTFWCGCDWKVTRRINMGLCYQGPGMHLATVQCNGWLDLPLSPAHIPAVQEWCSVTSTRNNFVSPIFSYV